MPWRKPSMFWLLGLPLPFFLFFGNQFLYLSGAEFSDLTVSHLPNALFLRRALLAYTDFVNKAAKGRKMKPEDLLKLAGGRVWTGRQAHAKGLVDKLGDLHDTIELAIQRTGLRVRPQIVNFPQPKGFFEMFDAVSSREQGTLPLAAQRLWALLATLPAPLSAPLHLLFRTQAQNQHLLMYHPIPSIHLR